MLENNSILIRTSSQLLFLQNLNEKLNERAFPPSYTYQWESLTLYLIYNGGVLLLIYYFPFLAKGAKRNKYKIEKN